MGRIIIFAIAIIVLLILLVEGCVGIPAKPDTMSPITTESGSLNIYITNNGTPVKNSVTNEGLSINYSVPIEYSDGKGHSQIAVINGVDFPEATNNGYYFFGPYYANTTYTFNININGIMYHIKKITPENNTPDFNNQNFTIDIAKDTSY